MRRATPSHGTAPDTMPYLERGVPLALDYYLGHVERSCTTLAHRCARRGQGQYCQAADTHLICPVHPQEAQERTQGESGMAPIPHAPGCNDPAEYAANATQNGLNTYPHHLCLCLVRGHQVQEGDPKPDTLHVDGARPLQGCNKCPTNTPQHGKAHNPEQTGLPMPSPDSGHASPSH